MKTIIKIFCIVCLTVILWTCKKVEPENRDFDPTISMSSLVSVNTSEIGGNGLNLISSRDDDSPLLNKTFNTVVSKEGEQLLLVTDAKKELRALTLSTPSSLANEIMQIDAHSTAISLVFIAPGILTIEPQEAKTTISNIENLTSFSALKTYLTNNLLSKSLNDLSQEILYDSLLTDCIEEFFQIYKSIPKTSDKGIYEDKNRFSVNTLPNKQIEFSNSGFRFVDVVERDINSLNSQVGSIKEIVPQMKGGIGLSWGSLLTWSVANPTKDTITYSPTQNTSYTEIWVLGPGFKKYNDPLPQEIKDLNYVLPYISTGFYYLALPVLDLIAGVKSALETKSAMFKAFMTSMKSTVSLSDITNAGQNQDSKGYKRGFINLSVTIISVIAAQSATAAAGSFLATYGPPTAVVLVSTSVFFSTANLFGFFYDEARIEPYAKYNIIPASGLPVVPTLVSPQNNSVNISIPVKLAWTNSINASSYEIQVSKNIGFSSLEFTESLISINQKEVSTLPGNTKYYWRVNSRNSNGTSDWSPIWSFTTVAAADNPPTAPSSPDPSMASSGVSTSPILSWSCTDPDGDALTYDIYFGTTINPTTTIATNQSATSITRTSLPTNTTYYWKVVAKDSKGATTSGPVWSFTTQISSADGIIFNPDLSYGSATDVEGNVYKTIQIGTQLWMAENLKTTKYNDASNIPLVTDNTVWGNLTTPAYCWYANSSSTYKATYGAMYNWYAVNTGKLCPTGWHVPSHSEWTTFTNYLGGEIGAGGKIKESGTTHWLSPNTGANNSSGFTALPGGIRNNNPSLNFGFNGHDGYWWSATEYSSTVSNHREVHYSTSNVLNATYNKSIGLSVRCIKDN